MWKIERGVVTYEAMWKEAELCTATATPNSYHDVLKKRCGLVAAGACAIFGKVFGLNLLLYNIYQIVRYVHVFWSAETNMCFHDLPRASNLLPPARRACHLPTKIERYPTSYCTYLYLRHAISAKSQEICCYVLTLGGGFYCW